MYQNHAEVFFSAVFFPLESRSCPTVGHQSCGKGSRPHSAAEWKGLNPVLSPDKPQISALFIGAVANSPASPRKDPGELCGAGSGSWDFSPQPPQSWRISPQQDCIYQLLGKSVASAEVPGCTLGETGLRCPHLHR